MTGADTYHYDSIGKKNMTQILVGALDKDVVERLKKTCQPDEAKHI